MGTYTGIFLCAFPRLGSERRLMSISELRLICRDDGPRSSPEVSKSYLSENFFLAFPDQNVGQFPTNVEKK